MGTEAAAHAGSHPWEIRLPLPGFLWVGGIFVPCLSAPPHVGIQSSWLQFWGTAAPSSTFPRAEQLWVHERGHRLAGPPCAGAAGHAQGWGVISH